MACLKGFCTAQPLFTCMSHDQQYCQQTIGFKNIPRLLVKISDDPINLGIFECKAVSFKYKYVNNIHFNVMLYLYVVYLSSY